MKPELSDELLEAPSVTELKREHTALDGNTGIGAVPDGEPVTGQTVVVTAMTEVTTAVPLAGHSVTSGPHLVRVRIEVV